MQWKEEVNMSFPDELKGIPLEMGIDEAGRGPALGPMVYGSAFAEVGYKWPTSVNDSKKLTPHQREENLKRLKNLPVGFGVRVLSSVEISAKMLAPKEINLNEMSHDSARMLVQAALDAGLQIKKLYVDTVGPEAKYQEKLKHFFPNIEITVTPRADSKFKVVSAASINAKVLRDQLVRDYIFEEPEINATTEFGSGYPGDPVTVEWLKTNFDNVFGFPSIVRFSWGTIKDIFAKNELEEDYDSKPKLPIDSTFYAQRWVRPVLLKKNE
ncbi:Ribonuclease H2 subunit A [Histomonas meleagridis]|uniref:Ribonuclease H2 subunit A n=1 Tax=Histomonas meleagridis TaxID=135588 RepID=UPI00355A35B7|nr:Ribonuclease H2 subunit A [Histomonas meleagridis]KAH0799439.1 Ribonuclease H2 subunit A [Histomonas meleagridis]